ncbi:MAG: Qat anti-phage system TatD family nuclease QatD [Planctomycetota bacterium]
MTAGRTPLVDFHCHVDLMPDPPGFIRQRDRQEVRTLAVTTTPRAWPQNREWAAGSTHVRPALGMHPQVVAERADEIDLFEAFLSETRYVGEVGLDGSKSHTSSLDLQKAVFNRILSACAREGERILSVHSLRADVSVLDAIEELLPPTRGTVVLHWFTGSTKQAVRAVELGCYFSLNPLMLQTPRHQQLVRAIPLDRLLTETDAPFARGSLEEGGLVMVEETIGRIAELHDMPGSQVTSIIQANLGRLLRT